jgi:glycosyltransferase involved in cell wall biosynthesis
MSNRFSNRKRVLISTLPLINGGTTEMTRVIVGFLQDQDFEVTLAHYMPYSLAPSLSVPTWRIFHGTVKFKTSIKFSNVKTYEIGSYIPELEWMHYIPNKHWRKLIREQDIHICISGSVLASLPLVLMGKKCISWVATPFNADRNDRVKKFPLIRRFIDSIFDRPVCTFLEKWLLKRVKVLALSNYTKTQLIKISGVNDIEVMPMLIDEKLFHHSIGNQNQGKLVNQPMNIKIGFAGRFSDPRKNILLLLDALRICISKKYLINLELIGDTPTTEVIEFIKFHKIEKYVLFIPHLDRADLGEYYRRWKIFIIPSTQEGLAIAGLEAMACGCAVISTKCGGPEEYVFDLINGFLVDLDSNNIAEKIITLISNDKMLQKMSTCSVEIINKNYTKDKVKSIFFNALTKI